VVDVVIQAEQRQPGLNRFYEADMAMHLLRMAREGYGITWVPESAVEEEIAAGKLVRAGGPEWSAQLEIWSFRSIGNTNQTMLDLWKSLRRTRADGSAHGALYAANAAGLYLSLSGAAIRSSPHQRSRTCN
jgi:DNA-binding transcriptional LysR family regulator